MLSLVVPTYNERHNLPTLLERLQAALADCGEPFEVIVVDDDSPDGTSAAARSLQSRFPWLRVLTRKHQRDLSTAVLAGWFEGRGDILGVIDGDLQHPPELLPTLLHRLKETGAELEIASRHVRGGGCEPLESAAAPDLLGRHPDGRLYPAGHAEPCARPDVRLLLGAPRRD